MDGVNPYATPRHAAAAQPPVAPIPLSIRKSLGIIGASGITLAICGALIGALLGALAPDYYRTVFPNASQGFDPIQVGVGLGLTQGTTAGVVVGMVVLVCVAISVRRQNLAGNNQ